MKIAINLRAVFLKVHGIHPRFLRIAAEFCYVYY